MLSAGQGRDIRNALEVFVKKYYILLKCIQFFPVRCLIYIWFIYTLWQNENTTIVRNFNNLLYHGI